MRDFTGQLRSQLCVVVGVDESLAVHVNIRLNVRRAVLAPVTAGWVVNYSEAVARLAGLK